MEKNRLEAFSDGVLAIIITIMVLEIKVPHGSSWADLAPLTYVFISYLLSFAYIGIYWGNHHHLLHTAKKVNSPILLANLNLLLWLSLIPFSTGWMGENHFESNTVALYSANLVVAGAAYYLLQKVIERSVRDDEKIVLALQKHSRKGMLSLFAYISAIPLAYVHPLISGFIFVVIAVLWFIPDKEIERAVK